jgi:uncharacterized metal-binding protein YceD (DUF177 family)
MEPRGSRIRLKSAPREKERAMTQSERQSERPWSVPVRLEEVPEQGRSFDMEADAAVRAAVARLAGVREVDQLAAHFDLRREGSDRLHVMGRVSATVDQTCVVTLEPLTNRVEETIDVVYAPPQDLTLEEDEDDPIRAYAEADPPESLVNGAVDLGAIATEFLILGIDPYPRKPGAVFAAPQGPEEGAHPFAGLAALKKKGGHVKD